MCKTPDNVCRVCPSVSHALSPLSLVGLSLFTRHRPSRHRAPPQRSHLPNRHIHSLQKRQADKVSNSIMKDGLTLKTPTQKYRNYMTNCAS